MKYASLMLIYLALLFSWNMLNRTPMVSEAVHVGIQEDLKRVIGDYIKENLPESNDLRFEKLWTELVDGNNQVKASFSYSFNEPSQEGGDARIEIEGYAILNQEAQAGDIDVWSFDELYILNNHIIFEDGITIGPGEPDEQ